MLFLRKFSGRSATFIGRNSIIWLILLLEKDQLSIRQGLSNSSKSFYTKCLVFFMKHELKITSSKQMLRALGNLMCVKNYWNNKENEVYLVLYKYSYQKFKKLTQNSSFWYLIKMYAENITEHSFDDNEKIALNMILNECEKTIKYSL